MKKHIVVVDDSITMLKLAGNTLNSHYKVTLLKSGSQAITFLKKHKPDLILLDINMPDMDGYETISAIKSNKETDNIPVIFLTGQVDEESESKGLELGAVDFIRKPFVAKTMISRINTQLELNGYREYLEKKVEEKTKAIEQLQDKICLSFAELVECRDENTGGHVKRTSKYVELLTYGLLEHNVYSDILTDKYVKDVIRSAPLHDIGKVGITDSVLLKNGALEEDEFEYMKQHSKLGYQALKKVAESSEEDSFFRVAQDMAHYHHEKWNGRGYPEGLKGDDIPLCARIMAIADVYDATTNKRPYKEAFSHEKSCEMILNGKGTNFDPKIIDVFEKIHYKFKDVLESYYV